MSVTPDVAGQLAIDTTNLEAVKRQARENPRTALKAAAQQFEAVFLQMVLKAMREATPQDGLMDSEQSRFYQQMFDQQLAQTLSKNGSTGLAAVMEQQLSRTLPVLPESGKKLPADLPTPMHPAPVSRMGHGEEGDLRSVASLQMSSPPLPLAEAGGKTTDTPQHVRDFVNRVWPHALEASRATGIPAHFLIAHAALETGWGRHEPRQSDGSPSHNLFGVKAGHGWKGDVVDATTSEYENGRPQNRVERFRAYNSYADSFRDYAHLLIASPRYAQVLGQQDARAFAQGLQRAGYATDPMYADKLTRIIDGSVLRQGLSS